MDEQTAKSIGENIAYIVLGFAAFLNIFKYFYSWIKEFFNKKKEDKKNKDSEVNINILNSPIDTSFKLSNDDYRCFLYFLLEQSKLLKSINELNSIILKEQMDYLHKHIQSIKIIVTDIMMTLLKDAGISDIHYGTYFTNFENFMEICETNVQVSFRQMCRNTHFLKYSISEYKDIVDTNILLIEGSLRELLRKRYPQKDNIKNFNKIYQTQSRIHTELKDCFDYARDVSIAFEAKLKSTKDCFEKEVSKVIGVEYTLDQ